MMNLGDTASWTRTFTPEDVAAYVDLVDSDHVNDALPEPLLGALFTYLLGVELPGPGANYLKQNTQYLRQATVGEPITARVTVTRLRPEKRLVDLETICTSADGTILCEGRALLRYADSLK